MSYTEKNNVYVNKRNLIPSDEINIHIIYKVMQKIINILYEYADILCHLGLICVK